MQIQAAVPRPTWQPALRLVDELAHGQAELAPWARELARTQQPDGSWQDHDSSVLAHTSLATYLRRTEHAREFKNKYTREEHARFAPDAETLQLLEACLAKSWTNLTGAVPTERTEFLGPLGPALEGASRGPADVHEALLGDSLDVRLDPKGFLDRALVRAESGVVEPQVEKPVNWTGVGLAAAAGAGLAVAARAGALGWLAELAAGAATGWVAASYSESLVHDKVAHSHDLPGQGQLKEPEQPSFLRRVYEKSPKWLQESIFCTWFGHTKIHHYRTFTKDHVTQFRSPEEREKLDAYLIKQGREDLIDSEHGLTIGWKSYALFQAMASPSYAAALGGAALLGAGPLFALGFAGPAILYPFASKTYHRYTHMPAQDAMQKASLPMKLILQSDLSRFNVRRHFVHHENPDVNFNLMPGADWLRGKAQRPSVAQEEELRRLGVLW